MRKTNEPITAGLFFDPPGALLRQIPNPATEGKEQFLRKLNAVWDETGPCLGFPKPDGWRIQAHKNEDDVILYSRGGLDYTRNLSTVTEIIQNKVKLEQAILDLEVVGFDHFGNHLDAANVLNAPQHRCYLLDVPLWDGENVSSLNALERINQIWANFGESFDSSFVFAEYTYITFFDSLCELYLSCIAREKSGYDGLIIRRLRSAYTDSALKLKPEETIDAVIIGVFMEDDQLSSLMLASPIEENQWMPIAKVNRQFFEMDTIWSACQSWIREEQTVDLTHLPELPHLWIEPNIVVEVSLARKRLSKKQIYPLRSDRIKRCTLRIDKGIDQATPYSQVLLIADLREWTTTAQQRPLIG